MVRGRKYRISWRFQPCPRPLRQTRPDPREILACIVAMGTNMGPWKMAEVSGLGHLSMMTTARNYLRLETVRTANDAKMNRDEYLEIKRAKYVRQQTVH